MTWAAAWSFFCQTKVIKPITSLPHEVDPRGRDLEPSDAGWLLALRRFYVRAVFQKRTLRVRRVMGAVSPRSSCDRLVASWQGRENTIDWSPQHSPLTKRRSIANARQGINLTNTVNLTWMDNVAVAFYRVLWGNPLLVPVSHQPKPRHSAAFG